MTKVYLLRSYQDHGINEIIAVSNNVAFGLIESKIARLCTNRDFLIKPEIGVSKAFDTNQISKMPDVIKKGRRKKQLLI